jgi:DNA-binding NarL/FixJ family response regulator
MSRARPRARVLLADDHALVAAGIRGLLPPEFEVLGLIDNGRELVRQTEKLKPDLVLLDISMPDLNGIEAARQIRKLVPSAKLIFLTMHADPTFVSEAMRTGASGYVIKKSAPKELVAAMEKVLGGGTYITPLVQQEHSRLLGVNGNGPSSGSLTPRQREVLQLVAEGRSLKEIADRLFISQKTAEFHKRNIMRMLGLRSTAELTKYALRHGMVTL